MSGPDVQGLHVSAGGNSVRMRSASCSPPVQGVQAGVAFFCACELNTRAPQSGRVALWLEGVS